MKTATKTKTGTRQKEKPAAKIRPISNWVLIEPNEAEERTPGGILLPDTAREKPLRGKVVAVGNGLLLENGKKVPVSVEVGDEVLYGRYLGTEVKVRDVEYTLVRDKDLLGIVEK